MKKTKLIFNLKNLFLCLISLSVIFISCSKNQNMDEGKMEAKFDEFAKKYYEKVRPMSTKLNEAYWNASLNSNDSTWALVTSSEMELNKFLSDKENFKIVKEVFDSKQIKDPVKSRQLLVIYNELLSKQIDTNKLNELSKMGAEIEKKYSQFRTVVGNKKYSDNDVEEILKTSNDNKFLEQIWTAQKEIGSNVEKDIIKIVKLRNEIAKELGFSNYHEMSLKLSDQDPKEISKLFDELDVLTKDEFSKLKLEIDQVLSAKYKIKPEEMMPWNYQNRFFQEAPQIYSVDFDKYYQGKDLVKLTSDYYKGLNLPIDKIVAKSDLFEKPNKNQHAYCINIDRDVNDIRVLCNNKSNSNWMGTMLHEYGHALYENYYSNELPWSLKTPAHIFTTEAIAMIFGRFSTSPNWMLDMGLIKQEEVAQISDIAFKTLKLQQLVFSRWSQVMYRFEKSMYENPDQDLNKLWWDLVEKYQMMKKPAGRNKPDWATKIHIATSPCYYHNYHLGELFASQLYFTIADKVLGKANDMTLSFANQPKVGKFLIDNVFSVGAKYYWNDMIEKATGEKLSAKYYAKQFVNK